MESWWGSRVQKRLESWHTTRLTRVPVLQATWGINLFEFLRQSSQEASAGGYLHRFKTKTSPPHQASAALRNKVSFLTNF